MIALVTVNDTLTLIPNVPIDQSTWSVYEQASTFTDRAIYRLGETVHMKGYFKGYDYRTLSHYVNFPGNSGDKPYIMISVNWDGLSVVSVSTPIDPYYGTFNTTLDIPYNALYGEHSISVSLSHSSYAAYDVYLNSQTITIADPRLPTSTLDLSIDQHTFKPQNGSIPVTIATRSYTGTAIPNADVTLRWSLQRQFGDNMQTSSSSFSSGASWWQRIQYHGNHWYDTISSEIFGLSLVPTTQIQLSSTGDNANESANENANENENNESGYYGDEAGSEGEVEASTTSSLEQGIMHLRTGPTGELEHHFQFPKNILKRPVDGMYVCLYVCFFIQYHK